MAKISSIFAAVTVSLIPLASLFTVPTLAAAPCTQWELGDLRIVQNVYVIVLQLVQSGNSLQGEAIFNQRGAIEEWRSGQVDGTVSGNAIEFTAFWKDGTVGVYSGTIGSTGRVEGTTYDKSNPGSRARWHSDNRLSCLANASTTPSEPQLPVKKLGKKKIPQMPLPGYDAKLPGGAESAILTPQDPAVNDATCKSGFVWREARPEDLVCVTPKARSRTAKENKRAAKFVDPDGAYGPNSCIEGFVWREAFEGDTTCVPPEIRDVVREENDLGPSRRVGG